MNKTAKGLVAAARQLRAELDMLNFSAPVACVYNPLHYAWLAHEKYLSTYAHSPCRVYLLGMNPGPWGMAQTGVPFGEIDAVRNYLKIETRIDKPSVEHPKRPIEGFACQRSEVSGKPLCASLSQSCRLLRRAFRFELLPACLHGRRCEKRDAGQTLGERDCPLGCALRSPLATVVAVDKTRVRSWSGRLCASMLETRLRLSPTIKGYDGLQNIAPESRIARSQP